MRGEKDAFMIVAIIIILGIVWVFTGGPERAENQSLFIKPESLSETNKTYTKAKPKDSQKSVVQKNADSGEVSVTVGAIEQEIQKVQKELDEVQKELEKVKRFGESSPYEEIVTLSRSGAARTDPDEEYLTLSLSSRSDEKVIITDWTLESTITGKRVKIGTGSYLPQTGSVSSETAIQLNPGDKALITTGRSPIGTSFRINKCTGYFEQFQDFTPNLRRACPDPEDELYDFGNIPLTDDTCFNYIKRIPRCTMILSSTPLNVTSACWGFVTEEIHYTGCLKNHKGDSDFFGKEWRVYLGRNTELWRVRREVIKLLDQDGKTVDVLTY